jgi:hypothetical protein
MRGVLGRQPHRCLLYPQKQTDDQMCGIGGIRFPGSKTPSARPEGM